MGETVDVLVVGMSGGLFSSHEHTSHLVRAIAGNYGTGKRSGGVSTLICAVLDDRRMNNDDDDEIKFVRCSPFFDTLLDYPQQI